MVIVGAGFGGLWAARNLARAPCDVVHIVRLIGFRNRLQVLINWAYIFYERGVRLILPADGELLGQAPPQEAEARQRRG